MIKIDLREKIMGTQNKMNESLQNPISREKKIEGGKENKKWRFFSSSLCCLKGAQKP